MKFNFRKIISVLTSGLMIGSTAALAAAANFPAPFVANGTADVAVVYSGSANAAASDLTAASSIQAALNSELLEQTATGTTSGSTPSGGDSKQLWRSSDKLNLGNAITDVLSSAIITSDDLPNLLANGVFTNRENTEFKYEQKLTLGALTLNYFSESDYKDRTPSIGINLASSRNVLNYTLDFTTEAESDVSNSDLVDIETKTIKMLGKDYFILDAKNSTLKLTLLDAAASGIVSEGETKSVTAGGKTYDVKILTLSGTAASPEVKLEVSGETTEKLSASGTYKLTTGAYLGIKDISMRDIAGNVASVEFSIGSGKLELTNGQNIKLNDKTINELTSYLTRGSASGGKEKLSQIKLVWTTDDKRYITPGSDLVIPGFENVKLSMGSFVTPASEVTEVLDGSSDYMVLETSIKDSDVTIPFLYANGSGEFTGLGQDSSTKLVTSSATTNVLFNQSGNDEQMVVSWNSSKDSESYLLKFSVIQEDGINKTDIDYKVDGAWTNKYTGKKPGDSATFGSLTLVISDVVKVGSDKWVLVNGSSGTSFNALYTKGGLKIALPYTGVAAATTTSHADGLINFTVAAITNNTGHSYDSFYLFATEEDKDGNVAKGTKFNITIDDKSDGKLEVSDYDAGRAKISDPDDSNHKTNYVYSDLATKVEQLGDSSSQRTAKVTYASEQSYGEVYLAAPAVTIAPAVPGETGVPVLKDSEAASSTANLIVVGGSCINSIAAELLGGAYCEADFTAKTGVGAGQYLIATYTRANGKLATLVAGYAAEQTTAAASALVNTKPAITAGSKVVGP